MNALSASPANQTSETRSLWFHSRYDVHRRDHTAFQLCATTPDRLQDGSSLCHGPRKLLRVLETMDRHDSDKMLHLGPRENYAPEVAPSDQPVLHHHDSEGLQAKEDDSKVVVEQVETTEDKEVLAPAAPRRRKRWILAGLFTIVLVVGLSTGLGVGLRSGIDNNVNNAPRAE